MASSTIGVNYTAKVDMVDSSLNSLGVSVGGSDLVVRPLPQGTKTNISLTVTENGNDTEDLLSDAITNNWIENSLGTDGVYGSYVWYDSAGDKYYYSNGSTQYVWDTTNKVWTEQTWQPSGAFSFSGNQVFTIDNVSYVVKSNRVYRLFGDTWGLVNIYVNGSIDNDFIQDGSNLWTDGTDYYYSKDGTSYEVEADIVSIRLVDKTWNINVRSGLYVWNDDTDTYYSNGSAQYKLDNGSWVSVSWSGANPSMPQYIWKFGSHIFYSYGEDQYSIDTSTHTLTPITWNGLSIFNGTSVWNDGYDVYYDAGTSHYYLQKPVVIYIASYRLLNGVPTLQELDRTEYSIDYANDVITINTDKTTRYEGLNSIIVKLDDFYTTPLYYKVNSNPAFSE